MEHETGMIVALPTSRTWADMLDLWATSHETLAATLRQTAAEMRVVDEAAKFGVAVHGEALMAWPIALDANAPQ